MTITQTAAESASKIADPRRQKEYVLQALQQNGGNIKGRYCDMHQALGLDGKMSINEFRRAINALAYKYNKLVRTRPDRSNCFGTGMYEFRTSS